MPQLRTPEPGPPGRAEAFNETAKMPAKQPQLRVDPTDGKAYPWHSFLEFYGEDEAQRRWATAGQQPASAGISRFCVSIMVSVSTFSSARPLSFCPSLEPFFLPVALALTLPLARLSVAPLPLLLSLHSLLACLLSCRALHVALVV